MNSRTKVVAMLMTLVLVSGCASMGDGSRAYDQWRKCVLTGMAVGGATGAAVDSEALAGAAAGAVIGAIWCAARPGDADGDGVRDEDDRCPGTPPGVEVDQNGCEPDFDGDGVPDRLDKCPDTPAGARVDANGCELDSDGDGVVDSKDKCPDTAEGQPVDNDGCDLEETYELNGVYFEFDSAKLTADSKAALDDALAILKRHPDLEVEIAGHTDSRGSDSYNLGLSERRAKSVLKYMVANGANADMLTAKGYGESEPVADNATDAGRAKNRRVELRHD